MLYAIIGNISVLFGGLVVQQTIAIPTGTNCAPLLACLFLYDYVPDFSQGLLQNNDSKLAQMLMPASDVQMMFELLTIR